MRNTASNALNLVTGNAGKNLAPTTGPPITRSFGFFNSLTNVPLGLIGLAAESKSNECRNAPSLQIAKRGFRESKGAWNSSFLLSLSVPRTQDNRGSLAEVLTTSRSDGPTSPPLAAGVCSRGPVARLAHLTHRWVCPGA